MFQPSVWHGSATDIEFTSNRAPGISPCQGKIGHFRKLFPSKQPSRAASLTEACVDGCNAPVKAPVISKCRHRQVQRSGCSKSAKCHYALSALSTCLPRVKYAALKSLGSVLCMCRAAGFTHSTHHRSEAVPPLITARRAVSCAQRPSRRVCEAQFSCCFPARHLVTGCACCEIVHRLRLD